MIASFLSRVVARIRAPRLWRILVTRGLYQIGLAATLVLAWRVLQGPSTMNFFLLESVAGATVGIYLSVRLATAEAPAPRDGGASLPVREEVATSQEFRTTIENGAINPPEPIMKILDFLGLPSRPLQFPPQYRKTMMALLLLA